MMTERAAQTPTLNAKRQQYFWLPDVKISDLLEANVEKRAQSAYSTSRRLTCESLNSQSLPVSKPLFQRPSPDKTPWLQYYKFVKSRQRGASKSYSSNIADIEKKLSSLVLNHSDDEIFKRNFVKDDSAKLDDAKRHLMLGLTGEEPLLSGTPAEEKMPKTNHKSRIQSSAKSFEVVKLPSKSSKRHRFCLSNFPHTKRRQKALKTKEIDEFQNEVTIDQKGLKQSWEYHVLAKLSGETQCFINHRFDGKEKPKEKLIDFLDPGYRDRDRSDYMTRKKKRLFDMPYKHEDFPNASTHL